MQGLRRIRGLEALYYDKEFGREKILEKASTSANFCLKVESIIDSISKEDISKIIKKFEEIESCS